MDIRAILKRSERSWADMFDVSLAGTGMAVFWRRIRNLFSLAGIKAIKKAAKDFYFTVAKIKNNEKYSGKIPFYANVMLGLFDSSKLEDSHGSH